MNRTRQILISTLAAVLSCAATMATASASASATAIAGVIAPTLSVGNVSGPAGSTRSVPFAITTGTTPLSGVQFEIVVPVSLEALPTSASGPGGGVALICGTPSGDRLICLIFNDFAPLPQKFSVTVNFIAAIDAQPGILPLNVNEVFFVDPAANDVPPGALSNGSFQIVQVGPAVFGSEPAPATELDFGNVVHGQSATRSVLISNLAMPDFLPLQMNDCSVAGSSAWQLELPGTFPQSIAAGASLEVRVRMNSSSSLPALVQGGLACMIDEGAGPASVSWPLRANAVIDALFADGYE